MGSHAEFCSKLRLYLLDEYDRLRSLHEAGMGSDGTEVMVQAREAEPCRLSDASSGSEDEEEQIGQNKGNIYFFLFLLPISAPLASKGYRARNSVQAYAMRNVMRDWASEAAGFHSNGTST